MGEIVFKTVKYHYKCSSKVATLLRFLCHISKNIYNASLYRMRQDYFKFQKIQTYFEYNKLLSTNENFHILNTYQSICTIRSAHSAMSLFQRKKIKLPHYLKKDGYFSLITDQIRPVMHDGKLMIKIPLSNIMRTNRIYKEEYNDSLINKFIDELNHEPIEAIFFGIPKMIKNKTIKQIRITPKEKGTYFEIEFTYLDELEFLDDLNEEAYASIDVGINNLASIVTSYNESFLIDGKRLKSINQFFNKKRSYYQSKLTDSKSKRLVTLNRRHNARVRDYINKAVNQCVQLFINKKIKNIIIGYNKGLKEGGIKNTELIGKDLKRVNQTFQAIPISLFVNKLKYKLDLLGFQVQIINESYTSKASFYDGDEIKEGLFSGERIKRGLYQTGKNTFVNADINAALNILAKSKPNDKIISYLRDRGLTIPTRISVSL